jgi:hypothetical protein
MELLGRRHRTYISQCWSVRRNLILRQRYGGLPDRKQNARCRNRYALRPLSLALACAIAYDTVLLCSRPRGALVLRSSSWSTSLTMHGIFRPHTFCTEAATHTQHARKLPPTHFMHGNFHPHISCTETSTHTLDARKLTFTRHMREKKSTHTPNARQCLSTH